MKNDYDRQILSYLNDHEMLTTEAAMEFLPLSEVSVRRIFNRLAELNLVRRVRGGVRQPVREQNIRIPYFLRGQWFAAEKQRLAKRAAELVKPDMAVAIHGGSTTSFLGMYLDHGTLIVNPSASMIFRIAENTDKLIFIADHSKFRRKAYARGPAWEDIDVLITDFDPENHERLKEIRARGVEVIIVPNAE